jgi:hypothetical protein
MTNSPTRILLKAVNKAVTEWFHAVRYVHRGRRPIRRGAAAAAAVTLAAGMTAAPATPPTSPGGPVAGGKAPTGNEIQEKRDDKVKDTIPPVTVQPPNIKWEYTLPGMIYNYLYPPEERVENYRVPDVDRPLVEPPQPVAPVPPSEDKKPNQPFDPTKPYTIPEPPRIKFEYTLPGMIYEYFFPSPVDPPAVTPDNYQDYRVPDVDVDLNRDPDDPAEGMTGAIDDGRLSDEDPSSPRSYAQDDPNYDDDTTTSLDDTVDQSLSTDPGGDDESGWSDTSAESPGDNTSEAETSVDTDTMPGASSESDTSPGSDSSADSESSFDTDTSMDTDTDTDTSEPASASDSTSFEAADASGYGDGESSDGGDDSDSGGYGGGSSYGGGSGGDGGW